MIRFVEIKNRYILLLLSFLALSCINYRIEQNDVSSEKLRKIENSEAYFVKEIDINKDGVNDKVVSSQKYQGNELYFFQKKSNGYELVLQSINFSEDGGRIIGNILSVQNNDEVLSIQTFFPDRGKDIATYYIAYVNNTWVLTRTVFETSNWTNDYTKTYKCNTNQNISLTDLNTEKGLERLQELPPEELRGELCDVYYYIEDSLQLFVKRFKEDDLRIINEIERYDALMLRHPLSYKNISTYNNIGYYLEQAGLFSEAKYLLEKVTAKFPSRTVAYINLGDAYWGLEEYDNAKQAYRTYITQMKANGKEAKIPARIFERVKE